MEPNTMLKTDPGDDKFFLRPLISKQHSSMINLNHHPLKSTSLRVAYTGNGGVSAGVPFLWESKPGTPKHLSSNTTSSSTFFPPLNPPPRTYNRNVPQTPMRLRRRAKSFALRNLFPVKFLRNKSRHSEDGHGDAVLAPGSLSPSSSSSASSVTSSPVIRPLAIFRRSHSTSIRHNKSVFDYDLYDDKSTSASCGFVRCFL